mmetsp:Transcript_14710/g.22427  ORF Transcript_14710/g.22427 Transcript_14710/m.22427 type:complete len:350 (-) Transcript_14710:450-1499(-)|eukprot:CAMPEP_0118697714 /NCGR_PEP_ID=MMETSP0800-20121206/14699_1 /TAXON_ID=210618 ORGANISM="Striatella unipunctata, Strain CCMP2910" /NCGR_SAMPLE_ID=MMETSP0800 /ASSEMBLY_ACC=CAM_ASM_000638 /LENGTH=349 /DNA_ID=CAMNT_0006597255 /DNA_START=103 /DNA_END=1152 /DNA_ORIENTATION=-
MGDPNGVSSETTTTTTGTEATIVTESSPVPTFPTTEEEEEPTTSPILEITTTTVIEPKQDDEGSGSSAGKRRRALVIPKGKNGYLLRSGLSISAANPNVYVLESALVVPTHEESIGIKYKGSERRESFPKELRDRASGSFIEGNLAMVTRNRGNIRWGNIEIREYERTIGDNPSCSGGPPLSLGWEYDRDVEILPIEEYEELRPDRRTHFQMLVPKQVRNDMLLKEWKVPKAFFVQQMRTNTRIRNQRLQTVSNLGKIEIVEEFIQKLVRATVRRLKGRKKTSVLLAHYEQQADNARQVIDKMTAAEAQFLAQEEQEFAFRDLEREEKMEALNGFDDSGDDQFYDEGRR